MLRVKRADVNTLFVAMGYSKATKWSEDLLQNKIRALPADIKENGKPEGLKSTAAKLLASLVKAVKGKEEIDVVEGEAEPKPKSGKKTTKSAAKKKSKPAADDDGDEDDDDSDDSDDDSEDDDSEDDGDDSDDSDDDTDESEDDDDSDGDDSDESDDDEADDDDDSDDDDSDDDETDDSEDDDMAPKVKKLVAKLQKDLLVLLK